MAFGVNAEKLRTNVVSSVKGIVIPPCFDRSLRAPEAEHIRRSSRRAGCFFQK